MKYRIVDLETAAIPGATDWLDPLKPPANYSKPESIEKWRVEAEAERQSKLGLDIDCNRIVALGWVDVGYGDPKVHLASNEFEEREGLKLFWDGYRDTDTRLVTFNGFKFDLPVLMRRSMYLDVPHPVLNLDRYRSPHVDLWQRLSFNGTIPAHSLRFYAKRMGFTTLDKIDGADIQRLVDANTPEAWSMIHDHCESDVALTHALANRLGLLKLTGVAA